MKIALKKGQITFIRVQAPRSKEVFIVELELEDSGIEGYNNLQEDKLKELTRVQIREAAEKLKSPLNYAPNQAYNNLMSIEHGVGSSHPTEAEQQRQKRIL
jgi:hypothetical protein